MLEKLRPKLVALKDNFKQLSAWPTNVVQLFAGQLAAQLAVALALGAALHAFNTQMRKREYL